VVKFSNSFYFSSIHSVLSTSSLGLGLRSWSKSLRCRKPVFLAMTISFAVSRTCFWDCRDCYMCFKSPPLLIVAVFFSRASVLVILTSLVDSHEHGHADGDVCTDNVEPDLWCERTEEREKTGTFAQWTLKEDTDAKVHERLREVYHLFTQIVDCQRRHRQISVLGQQSRNIS